jgi:hypothetical protein
MHAPSQRVAREAGEAGAWSLAPPLLLLLQVLVLEQAAAQLAAQDGVRAEVGGR